MCIVGVLYIKAFQTSKQEKKSCTLTRSSREDKEREVCVPHEVYVQGKGKVQKCKSRCPTEEKDQKTIRTKL